MLTFYRDIGIRTSFILMLCHIIATGSQNANLIAVPAKATPGDSITFTCNYIGTGEVSAVSWFNGSNSDVLILTPGSIVPECNVFLITYTSYDPTRISYTCDVARNMYTLRIDPLGTVDNGVKWSCTFIDPQPDAKQAEYTINLTENQANTDNEGLSTGAITGITVGSVAGFFGILVVAFVKCFKGRIKSYTVNGT